MQWRKAAFKGKTVWAEVNEAGEPVAMEGRVQIRYSPSRGAKLYRAGASRVSVLSDSAPEDLPPGKAAEPPDSESTPVRGGRSGGGKEAAQAATELLARLPGGTIRAYTDGACRGNPGPAGSGVYIEFPDGRKLELARSLGKQTNNIAELTAIELALEQLEKETEPRPMAVLTDSNYAIGVLVKGWTAKANQELVRRIKKKVEALDSLEFHWVAGHVGTEGNEKADALANAGVEGLSFEQWS